MLAFVGVTVAVLVGALGYLAHRVVRLTAVVNLQAEKIEGLTKMLWAQNRLLKQWLVPPSDRARLH